MFYPSINIGVKFKKTKNILKRRKEITKIKSEENTETDEKQLPEDERNEKIENESKERGVNDPTPRIHDSYILEELENKYKAIEKKEEFDELNIGTFLDELNSIHNDYGSKPITFIPESKQTLLSEELHLKYKIFVTENHKNPKEALLDKNGEVKPIK